MTINDLKLLNVKVYDGENIIYEGKCEDVPVEISKLSIEVLNLLSLFAMAFTCFFLS